MSRPARVALAAAVVVAAFTHAAADAAERATLRVTARVVDRCTIDVPFEVPPWLWRDRRHEPWSLVRHVCQGGPPLRVDVRSILLAHLRERLPPHLFPDLHRDGGRVLEVRHPTRDDIVLITITY